MARGKVTKRADGTEYRQDRLRWPSAVVGTYLTSAPTTDDDTEEATTDGNDD